MSGLEQTPLPTSNAVSALNVHNNPEVLTYPVLAQIEVLTPPQPLLKAMRIANTVLMYD